jgi:hypothetical protein
MKFRALTILAVLTIVACSTVVMDTSSSPVEAGDKTLVLSACQGTPVAGFDACRVKEGQAVDSVWRLFFPVPSGNVTGGEVQVNFKDVVKSYAITGPLLEIPWADFFEDKVWRLSYNGIALALAVVRYKDKEGIEETVRARGEARVLVLKEGYDPMPIGSPFGTFKTKCVIEYSTAGRSAVKCEAD